MSVRRSAPTIATLAGASVALLAASVALLTLGNDDLRARGAADRLMVYCAAGLQRPVAAIARDYERETGTQIELQYGGSGSLLSSLRVTRAGDLYLAADDSYTDRARAEGLVREVFEVATMRPVIGVRSGNPLGIVGVSDLVREDVRVGLAHPGAAAVGKVSQRALEEVGLWREVERRAAVFKPTVSDLANDLEIGAIDAAVIWDATVAQFAAIEAVRTPELDAFPRNVCIGVLDDSAHPTAALRFARYLAARDRGLRHFASCGFVPVAGDLWAMVPELLLMGGAMLRQAVDETIREFEMREGVRVTRNYNGCGILVAQMRTGAEPDAYFSCDQSFLDIVAERFEDGLAVSENRIVLLVRKGNPPGIESLADLARPDLRVGLGHPEKSALGVLTDRLLVRRGLRDRLYESGNVVVESATGDYLVNQIRAGSLDATVVYRSNAAAARGELDLITVEDPAARAVQPFAIARDSDHKHTMRRLLQAIVSAASRHRFEELGFRWQAEDRDR